MDHGSEFERLLDAHLAQARRDPMPSAWPVDARPDPSLRFAMWGGGVPPVSPFRQTAPRGVSPLSGGASAPWVGDPVRPSSPRGVPPVAGVTPFDPPVVDVLPRAPRPERRVKATSTADRAALASFARCGASLPESFTLDELKAAHRRLAFRYHPDQHPAADPIERATLAAAFTRVHAAYRQLAALFLAS